MTSKYARASVLLVTLIVGGCTAAGGATSGPTQQPVATRAAPPASLQASASTAVASATPEPSASPTASAGGVAGGQPTAGPTDPCSLLTTSEASHLVGVQLGAGKRQVADPDTICTWAKGTTEVKVFLTAPTDPAAAKAYYESHKSEIPPEAHITELPAMFDGAVIARATLPVGTISAIFVLDGINFFELYCGLSACTDDALKGGSELIAGRLP